MTHPIIKTENYLLVVDKLNCPAKEGQTFLTKEGLIHTNIGWNYGDSVIIYHLPLNNAPTLERVPLLPPLEDDVEKLEMEYFIELEKRREVAKNFTGQVAGRHPDAFGHSEMIYMNRGYIEGYNKAKEKYNKAKYPVAFESTIGVCSKWLAEQCDNNCCGKPEKIITITNSQGLIQLVGNYIYDQITSH